MPFGARLAKKEKYDAKLCAMLEKYDRAFIVHADNVGSNQFMKIRAALRPASVIIMGKNTMMKRSINVWSDATGNEKWRCLCDELIGNVGVIFTNEDLSSTRDEIQKHTVPAPAKAGAVAQCDVWVHAGNTGMDPSQTNFFQTLNIATKINKGTVEIVSDQKVVIEGNRVGASEATLLAKLKITPFTYGLLIQKVAEGGSVFSPKVLDITEADLLKAFAAGMSNVTALSLGANYPTIASVPHSFINGYKNLLYIAFATDYTFPFAEKGKAYLADPSAFVFENTGGGGGSGGGGDAAPAPAAAKAPEPEPEEEEEEEDMGFDLFD